MSNVFHFNGSYYKKLFFGENCYSGALTEIINENNLGRVYLITTNSLSDVDNFHAIKALLGDRLVAEFTQAKAHTPTTTVALAVQQIETQPAVDAIIAFGGSSVVDCAKAVAKRLNTNVSPNIISLPTTLSGAEFNANMAVTDENGIKHIIVDPQFAPAWIVLDPALTINTPNSLWASTGFKTFTDCIETVCSKKTNIYTDNFAHNAIRLLNDSLVKSYHDPTDMKSKLNALLSPAFALPAAVNSWLGLIAAFRHQIGACFNIGHGLASAIVMPEVLKWNFDYAVKQYAALAILLNLESASDSDEALAHAFLARVKQLVNDLDLNKKLSAYIEDKNSLDKIIKPVMNSPCAEVNPRPITSEADIHQILEAVW
jgi:alcohol dehydrogenase class IV